MKKEIYAVVREDYQIECYFSNRIDADKFCVKYSETVGEYWVEVVSCYDNEEDLSDIIIKYEHLIRFRKKNGYWKLDNAFGECEYEVYSSNYLRSNSISGNFLNNDNFAYIDFKINIAEDDRKLAEEIAEDLMRQFLESYDNIPISIAIGKMNNILHAAEYERTKKQEEEELKQKELAELKRLKEKYETG